MEFSSLTSLCRNIEKISSRNEKKRILKEFLLFWREKYDDIFLAIVFLTGVYEFDSIPFNLNEIEMAKYISEYLNIPLKEFFSHVKEIGDLGSLFLKLDKKSKNDNCKNFSVSYIFSVFDSIKSIKGKNSREEKKNILINLFLQINSLDICYLVRFLIGKLRLGLSYNTILEVLHDISCYDNNILEKKKLKYFFGITNDIVFIAQNILKKNYSVFSEVLPRVHTCIQPQAAEVYFKNKTVLCWKEDRYSIQPKLDGFRLQAHIDSQNISLFSRNCLNSTIMFPDIVEVLKSFRDQNSIENIILDGEIIAFDKEKKIYLNFEETAKRKRIHDIETNSLLVNLKFIIFDILFFNGKEVLRLPYEKRFELLSSFVYQEDTINMIENYLVGSDYDLDMWYKNMIQKNYEGIMIKKLCGKYEPGQRKATWLKYKEVQKDSLEDLFDLVVLGFNIAKGARKGRQEIGSLLVGLYDEKSDEFKTVAQIGSGGSSTLWKELEDLLSPSIMFEKPSNVSISNKHFPDVLVYPSVVVSIKADKISVSNDHTFGYSIRFPRFISIRKDKNKYQTHFPLVSTK